MLQCAFLRLVLRVHEAVLNAMAPQFTPQQRAFAAATYFETGSYNTVQRRWQNRFPDTRVPSKAAIYKMKNVFLSHGTVNNRNRGRSGRPRTSRSPANIAAVNRELHQNPRVSSRRNGVPQVSRSSFLRIVKKEIRWHAYRIKRRHKLNPGDPQRRLAFCNWFINRPQRFLREVVIVDEATFTMRGSVTTTNVREYAPKGNPPVAFDYDIPDDRRKLSVLAAITGNNQLIGPVFINGNLNGVSYLNIINNTLEPELRRIFGQQRNGAIRRAWFIQDGAPAHRRVIVHNRLQELFPNRVIGLGHPTEWPPRSPDLTPLDFWLWGDVKSRVYHHDLPAKLPELRRRIENAFTAIRRTRITQNAVRHMRDRALKCIEKQGHHVEGRN